MSTFMGTHQHMVIGSSDMTEDFATPVAKIMHAFTSHPSVRRHFVIDVHACQHSWALTNTW